MNTFERRRLRDELVHWMSDTAWDDFLTLHFNQPSNPNAVRARFKEFCQRFDRQLVGPKYYRRPEQRTLIVALPEHIYSNAHLHTVVLYRTEQRPSRNWRSYLATECWGQVLASGTTDMRKITGRYGLASYITKDIGKNRHSDQFIMSSEFWPQ